MHFSFFGNVVKRINDVATNVDAERFGEVPRAQLVTTGSGRA